MGANAQTTVPSFSIGQVLEAAQLNQSARTGVPVFAGTTERNAAFGGAGEKTLAEGQLAYIEALDVVQMYDGANWVTVGPQPAPQSGLNYITGAAFTSVASFSFANDTFTSTYRNYRIVVDAQFSSNNQQISFRLRASGTDNSAANYEGGLVLGDTGGTARIQGSLAQTSFRLSDTFTGVTYTYSMDIVCPQIARITSWSGTMIGVVAGFGGGAFGGQFGNTTQFDAMSFLVASGNMTGAYRVYGYSDS